MERLIHIALDEKCMTFMLVPERRLRLTEIPDGCPLHDAFLRFMGKGEVRPEDAVKFKCVTQVIAEIQLTLDFFMSRRWLLPTWLVLPKDRTLRMKAHVEEEWVIDSGNMVWEAVFFASGLARLAEPSFAATRVLAVPNVPYGGPTSKSAKGPVNLRGNMVEGLFGYLHGQMQKELRAWRQRNPYG